jgi:VCBS repeat-containing protein
VVTVDVSAPVAPTIALAADTGVSATDGITNNGTVTIGNLEPGATFQYSTDGGATWINGTGTGFVLGAGTYAAGAVEAREVDAAGNIGAATSLGVVTVDVSAPVAPTIALAADTGVSATDGITNNGAVTVGNLEPGATFQYSTDGGATWINGTGTGFVLGAGTYAAGVVEAREVDAAGNIGAASSLGTVTVDTAAPVAPTIALAADTGISATDGITNDGTVTVGNLEPGATFQYSTDGGATWTNGTGTGFVLGAGTYAAGAVEAREVDAAGNIGAATAIGAVRVDVSAPVAPTIALANDTGISATDGITNNGAVNIGNLEPGATFQYSTDGGATWTNGTGTGFVLGAGTYAAGVVEAREVDAAGNIGGVTSLGALTVDTVEAPPTSVAVSANGTVVTGQGDPGATVTVTSPGGGTVLGTAHVNPNGTFSVPIAAQAAGLQLQVVQTDLAGNTSAAAQATTPVLFQLTDDIASPAISLNALTTQTGVLGSASYLLGISALGALNLSVLGIPAVTFTVANGHQLDAVFNYSAVLSLGVLDNFHVVIQQQVDGQWQAVSDSADPYDLLNLSLLGTQALATTTLEGGTYRAFLVGDTGVVTASLLGTLSVSGKDHNYTVPPIATAVSSTGDVLTNDTAPAGSVVSSVTSHGITTLVGASGTTVIHGVYGTLTIAADGSYTYTPTALAADIGKAETFQYTVAFGGQTATANLYVQVGSPGASLTWSSTDPGSNAALAGGAVNDIATAGILNPVVHTTINAPLAAFTTSGSVFLAGAITGSTSTSFTVEANATAATTLHLQVTGTTGLGIGLLPSYTVHVTGPGTDFTTTAVALLTGGLTALDIAIPGHLASGTYQVTVNSTEAVVGVGSASYTTQVSVLEDVSHTTLFDAHSVNGDLLANDAQSVSFASLAVGHGAALAAVGAAGTNIAGTYGTLSVFADGSYHYQPNAALTYDPAHPTPLHDIFDYAATYANGATSTAHLDITIDVPGQTFTGTAAADTVHSTGGNDSFTLGGGADTIVYDNLPAGNGHDVWTDFSTTQSDKIDLSSLLTSVNADQSNLPTYLQVHSQSNGAVTNTVVSVDPTGTGHFTDLITLNGVNLTLDELRDHLVTAHQV